MKPHYLYINAKNELFLSRYTTPASVGDRITINIAKLTSIQGYISRKTNNGVFLRDWDVLNGSYLLQILEDDL